MAIIPVKLLQSNLQDTFDLNFVSRVYFLILFKIGIEKRTRVNSKRPVYNGRLEFTQVFFQTNNGRTMAMFTCIKSHAFKLPSWRKSLQGTRLRRR